MRPGNRRTWWPACLVAGLLCAAAPTAARAEVKLDPLFTKDAVLQQGMKVPVFGTGDPGEDVLVTIQNQQQRAVVDADGRWRVEFEPLKPGGPYMLNVTAARITTQQVMVGEVWVLAGGTNMQWEVMYSEGMGGAITFAGNRQFHLFTMRRSEGAVEPQYVSTSFWHSGGAASIGIFSAVGYYFGRNLQPYLKTHDGESMPIGLISCNHFESTIESWISREALEADDKLKKLVEAPISASRTKNPTVLFNSMVKPLTQFAVRGVVWYHGENEVDEAYEYRHLLGTLIADWRKQWNRPDLPFIIVQQAPYRVISKTYKESKYAELRDSQWHVSRELPKASLVVITDHGDQFDPNPKQKEPVGKRAALAARMLAYGEDIVGQGPTFAAVQFVRNEARIRFANVGTGLHVRGDELKGFVVAGADRVFHEATAKVEGDTVVVSSPEVTVPEAVRYGWADYPTGTLFNKEGLPASPFRTDNYRLTTQPE